MLFIKWCMIFIALVLPSPFSFITATKISQTMVVDLSGKGGFRSIQSAIDSVPSNNQIWTRINIKAGVYREQVIIPHDKPFIFLKGEGKRNTIIVWNAHDDIAAGATFASEADHTLAKDITFTNSYNSHNRNGMARAVAARIQGDKSAFYRCGFFSLQDTLWDAQGRHYFTDCTIHGAVDYIFGAGQSLYQSCSISVASLKETPGYITAQGREKPGDTNGFVFKHCSILGKGKAYLGRPWRDYARVLFYNTTMSDVVVPQGWSTWKHNQKVNLLTLSEYGSRGSGADISERVEWAKKLEEEEVNKLASTSFIDDQGSWLKEASNILGFLIHKYLD